MRLLLCKISTIYNKILFWLYILLFNLKLFLWIDTWPYKITLKLNNNCNLKCNFCNIWKNKKPSTLWFEDLKKFIQNYWERIRILSFTGWEIFLLTDIEEKITYSLSHCKKLRIFSLTTNWFLTEKILQVIKRLLSLFPNVIFIINVSIDGDETTHNSLRGNPLSYARALNTYNELKKISHIFPNLEVNQEFLISSKNQSILEEKLKQKNTIVSFVQNSDYYWINNLNIHKITLPKALLKKTSGFLKRKFVYWYVKQHYDCFAIQSSIFIDWDSSIKPCIKWNLPLWNIWKDNLKTILRTKWTYNIIKKVRQKKCPWCWTPCEWYLSIIHQPWK